MKRNVLLGPIYLIINFPVHGSETKPDVQWLVKSPAPATYVVSEQTSQESPQNPIAQADFRTQQFGSTLCMHLGLVTGPTQEGSTYNNHVRQLLIQGENLGIGLAYEAECITLHMIADSIAGYPVQGYKDAGYISEHNPGGASCFFKKIFVLPLANSYRDNLKDAIKAKENSAVEKLTMVHQDIQQLEQQLNQESAPHDQSLTQKLQKLRETAQHNATIINCIKTNLEQLRATIDSFYKNLVTIAPNDPALKTVNQKIEAYNNDILTTAQKLIDTTSTNA